MALEDYWKVLRKWWWLIVASAIVATASSAYSLSREPRIYEATTTVIVGQGLDKANPTYNDFSIGQQLAQTYVNIVTRQPILQGAAETLGLDYVPWSGNVTAEIVAGTQLVEIRVRDTSPSRARALADEIAHQLILQTPTHIADNEERRAFVTEQLQVLEDNIKLTQNEIADEQAKLDAATSAHAIQQYESNIDALDQKLTSYQSNYAALLQNNQEATNYISVVDPASLPDRPISPNVPVTLALAATIGLGLATGGALLIESLDNTIRTAEDVEKITGLPMLGAVGDIQDRDGEGKLIAAHYPQSPITESFRALRTSIDYYSVDRPIRTIAITSAAPSEGKSVVLANLAVVMAQSGRRVVVVDADMRRPMQHIIFGIDNNRGLSDAVMARTADLSAYNHVLDPFDPSRKSVDMPTNDVLDDYGARYGSLRVVTAGPCPPNPADLLASERMRSLVDSLNDRADVVLFDTPPTMAVTDAVVLSKLVDGVLILACAGQTKRTAAREAVKRFRQVGANLLGVVLNRVSRRGASYGSYLYYYEYGQEQKKKGS